MREETDDIKGTRRVRHKSPEEALMSLMRLCSRAEKSSGDALRLMSGWGLSSADARKVLSRLESERFIDDRRYAEAYVREKTALNGWGVYKIRRMLCSKGIAPGIIESALRGVDVTMASDRLRELLERKSASIRGGNDYDLRGKLMRYGLSRGYEYDQVSEVVDEIMAKNRR